MRPKSTLLMLTVREAGSIRSQFSGVSSEDCQVMIGLFSGHTVEAKVFSGTNKCFDVTEQMIRDAWEKFDKPDCWWITEDKIPHLIERFTTKNQFGNTLAMTLPCLYCKETPAEIEEMLAA
jgi:hypothetical protein